MNKHTPGPWSIGSADNYTRRTIVGPREGMSHKLIARMPGEYRENHAIFPEMLANAHLIAAAPAMYEALKGLLGLARYIDQSATHEGLTNCDLLAKARQALTQAEGKP